MQAPRIQALLFDAVGTLIHPRPAVAEAYALAAARQSLVVPTDEVMRRFRLAFAAEERFDADELGGRTSPAREVERWRRIVAGVFPEAPAPEALLADLWSHFADATNWALYDDVEPLLALLPVAHLQWGIASNFDGRLTDIHRQMPGLASCRHLFISAELGWRKPSPAFFRAVEQRLGLRPAEILLVGDDPENDYLAARAAGWRALHLARNAGQLRATGQDGDAPPIAGDARIANLIELAARDDLVAIWARR